MEEIRETLRGFESDCFHPPKNNDRRIRSPELYKHAAVTSQMICIIHSLFFCVSPSYRESEIVIGTVFFHPGNGFLTFGIVIGDETKLVAVDCHCFLESVLKVGAGVGIF